MDTNMIGDFSFNQRFCLLTSILLGLLFISLLCGLYTPRDAVDIPMASDVNSIQYYIENNAAQIHQNDVNLNQLVMDVESTREILTN